MLFFGFLENELYYHGSGKKGPMQKVLMNMTDIVAVMKKYHLSPTGGHMGVNRTCARICKYYTWNGMKMDIMEYVRQSLPPFLCPILPPW